MLIYIYVICISIHTHTHKYVYGRELLSLQSIVLTENTVTQKTERDTISVEY